MMLQKTLIRDALPTDDKTQNYIKMKQLNHSAL